MSDVTYKEPVSASELPITDPIHAPCPDMAGMTEFDANKLNNARFLISKLRQQHGINKPVNHKRMTRPLNYTCTERGCIEPWGEVNNIKNEDAFQ